MVEGLAFHHVGVVSRDIARDTELLATLGYVREREDFADPAQGVRGRFVVGGGPRLELLAASGPAGVLEPWLKARATLYHLAYETADMAAALDSLRSIRGKVVVQPIPAVAFSGRRIAFVLLPNFLLVELIESRIDD